MESGRNKRRRNIQRSRLVRQPNTRTYQQTLPLSTSHTRYGLNWHALTAVGSLRRSSSLSSVVDRMSTNGGLNWVNQAGLQGANSFSPGRERASLIFDSQDSVYLLGGMWRGDYAMTNSIFRSSNLGVTWPWQDQSETPWEARGSGLFFNFKANPHALIDFGSTNVNREILVYTTGWNGKGPPTGLSNEVWISADYSRTWSRVRSNWGSGLAPFRARDAANGEVTEGGVMIIVGGQADDEQGSEPLNESANQSINQPVPQPSTP